MHFFASRLKEPCQGCAGPRARHYYQRGSLLEDYGAVALLDAFGWGLRSPRRICCNPPPAAAGVRGFGTMTTAAPAIDLTVLRRVHLPTVRRLCHELS